MQILGENLETIANPKEVEIRAMHSTSIAFSRKQDVSHCRGDKNWAQQGKCHATGFANINKCNDIHLRQSFKSSRAFQVRFGFNLREEMSRLIYIVILALCFRLFR